MAAVHDPDTGAGTPTGPRDTPIAVVGMACRLPGAPDPSAFWQLLREGRDAISEPPPGRGPARRGGYLDRVDGFDAAFFGVSPREALAMDPQQRLTLELGWEALEDAGIAPDSLSGTSAGVYVGAIADDYAALLRRSGPQGHTRHVFTGVQRGVIANRLSYALGLRGPSMTVDCGQSSSLVAVHLAVAALRRGEADLVLAGGVHLNLVPESTAAVDRFGALSPDGRCHTFDARANGFVRGEGGALVVLKPLSRALADRDRVYCVLSGSAVNHDGGTEGLTVPNAEAQREVVSAALADAGVRAADVQYVELHGTGTPVGDPVEAAALGAALGTAPGRTAPLAVGSAKTNVGHLEGAAGVVGLLKAALSLHHRELPASLNFETPNPAIPFERLRLRVQTATGSWPLPDRPLVAGVSAFGVGGTNAHLVLTEASPVGAGAGVTRAARAMEAVPESVGAVPLVVSAASPEALAAMGGRLAERLEADPQLPLSDAAYALATTRALLPHRAVVIAEGRDSALTGLRALADRRPTPHLITGHATATGGPGPVFVFPGQGSQWPGMAHALYAHNTTFRDSLEATAAALDPLTGWSLIDTLTGSNEEWLERVDMVQPALFAMMTALAHLWITAGIQPAAVIGHSQGEIAAAHIAGILTLHDATHIITTRSTTMRHLSGHGGMATINAPAQQIQQHLHGHDATIAAHNSPTTTVITGTPQALHHLTTLFEADGLRVRRVNVDYASHSPQVDPYQHDITTALAHIRPRAATIPMISTVTGQPVHGPELDPTYWYTNLRHPVLFHQALTHLTTTGHHTTIETSPHPILTPAIQESAHHLTTHHTLRRHHATPTDYTTALAHAHTTGTTPTWTTQLPTPTSRTTLPTYPFQHQRYWPKPVTAVATPEAATTTAEDEDEEAGAEVEVAEAPESPSGTPAAGRVLDVVLNECARVLGHASGADVPPEVTFKDLGFDSFAGTELCKQLSVALGRRVPVNLTYDHPSPAELAAFLEERPGAELPGVAHGGRAAEDGEPIVIVGMACRFPGGVRGPEDLWRLLVEERDAIDDFPADRGWNTEELYDPDPANPGTSYVRRGGFLDDIAGFDAALFGIAPREALAMDPHQRLLLETAWEVFESAGIDPGSLRGSRTGVFVGTNEQDYATYTAPGPAQGSEGLLLTGHAASVASGRLSYVFGLEGPALTVDTACSSSLVALHLAAQSLRAGECDLAVAGGATVMSTPGMFLEFSRQGGLSADGRCKAFDESADGTGWSEGVGAVLVERLSDARRNHHPVLALIRGSAVNQDGASNGLTAPNGRSQARLIRTALDNAGLTPGEVDAVEAHGTGTPLGDPIEVTALLATYGQHRPAEHPLYLGSLKSNIGHTQAAAGIAGVIKMVHALHHGLLPSSLHATHPTSHVDWTTGAIELLTEQREWPQVERARRAAVSAFGISGTNAHVILEQPAEPEHAEQPEAGQPDAGQPEEPSTEEPPPGLPLLLSAASAEALSAMGGRLAERLEADPQLPLSDAAYALATTRALLPHRAVVIAEGRNSALTGLRALADHRPTPHLITGHATQTAGPGPVFVFPGQGSQWPGMAHDLYAHNATFRESLEATAAALDPLTGWSLIDTLTGSNEEWLERVDMVQPALFAMMTALAHLWITAGIQPAAVIGHSQGEITAAHIAGILTLHDATHIITTRSTTMRHLSGHGGMATINAPAHHIQPRLNGLDATIAAHNSPTTTVITGTPQALNHLTTLFETQGFRVRRVNVDYASHSPQVDPYQHDITTALADIRPRAATIPMISTVTGQPVHGPELDPTYWYTNLRHPVLFHQALTHLTTTGHHTTIETSPHPILTPAIQETTHHLTTHHTLRRHHATPTDYTTALAHAHTTGTTPTWTTQLPTPTHRTTLPTYPFQHQRYWLRTTSPAGSQPGVAVRDHPLLSAAVSLAGAGGAVLTGALGAGSPEWCADHAVAGSVLLPGTAFVEMVMRVGDEVGCGAVAELTVRAPLALTGQVTVQAAVGEPDAAGRRAVTVHSRPGPAGADAAWTLHAEGLLAEDALEGVGAPPPGLASWPPSGADRLPTSTLYDDLAAQGYDYGPAFQGVRALWRRADEVFAEVELPPEAGASDGFLLHPALLDAALHVVAATGLLPQVPGIRLPFAWSGVRVHASGARALRVLVRRTGPDSVELTAVDGDGAPVVSVASLALLPVAVEALRATSRNEELFAVRWEEAGPAVVADGSRPGGWAARISGPGELDALGSPDELDALGSLEELRLPRGEFTDDAAPARVPHGDRPPVLLDLAGPAAPVEVCELVLSVLAVVRRFVTDPGLRNHRLVVRTQGAVAVDDGDRVTDPAAAAVWGLVRSAQSEHPGRFVLVDTDGGAATEADTDADADADTDADADPEVVPVPVGDEPQFALRGGTAYVPRLVRHPGAEGDAPPAEADAPPVFDPDRTVLVTGGTGSLGSLVARHLVAAHGVRRLLLLSRSGADAAGAAELVDALAESGAVADVRAGDIGDRDALAGIVAEVQASGHPLGAVLHLAGVLADATVEGLGDEAVAAVLRPKARAAWHLHELTAGLDLSAFVLFSSVAGVLGNPGQGNYAAANAFLDALALHRRQLGLPALSLAWGLWEQPSGMTGRLEGRDLARMRRAGLLPLPAERGLALLDAALAAAARDGGPVALVPARLDLRALVRAGRPVPPLLSRLAPRAVRRTAAQAMSAASRSGLEERLAGLPADERERLLLGVVRDETALVLGHASGDGLDVASEFRELGLDSLMAVEVRNRLAAVTGLALASTVVFDHPTPRALARFLDGRLAGADAVSESESEGARNARNAVPRDDREPVAIIGMACRYPGGVNGPDDLWRLVLQERDTVGEFPQDRGWDLSALFDAAAGARGTSATRHGGFLDDAAGFDPAPFGISPREALAMDPQQRLLLEVSWEALENAGIPAEAVHGSRGGVFAGLMYHDYGSGVAEVPEGVEGYLLTGGAGSVASGRIAYALGLEGPALTVDTACSSSLVALHLAAQSLRRGECDLALAGGVTVMVAPDTFVEFSRQGGLARDGRCKSFAEGADGTGWSEGVGMLLVERLPDALRNGHRVLAVLRGSAVNQDGASNGLTAPSGTAQQRVIREALADAGLAPADVDAVEGHGTGTRLGDPIEAGALLETYGRDRPAERPLYLGSVKSNLGHTQAAAGVAGIIKTVMALDEGVLPRSLHAGEPSSHVDWASGAVELLARRRAWPETDRPRRAAVSSFGISGTNAHVILEQAPPPAGPPERGPAPAAVPLLLSAADGEALRAQAARIAASVDSGTELVDAAWSLTTTRSALPWRAAVVAGGREQAVERLRAVAEGRSTAGTLTGRAREDALLAVVFSGQGSQRPGMGRELYASQPVFAAAFDEVCAHFAPHLEQPLRDVVFGTDAELLDRTDHAQAALFAVEVALYRLLEHWGVRPGLLIGHSIGGFAAACVAGVWSLADACALVAARGRLMRAVTADGAMAAVEATEEETRHALAGYGDRVGVAAVNGPSAVVVSGDRDAVEEVAERFRARGRRVRRLRVDHAFHSAHMDAMADAFAEVLAGVSFHPPAVPVVSDLTGAPAGPDELCSPSYWVRHVREPVRFADGVGALHAAGATAYLELGPAGVLTGAVRDSLPADASPTVVAALRADRPEPAAFVEALSALHLAGLRVDWARAFEGTGARTVALPGYPFRHRRFWLSATARSTGLDALDTLGTLVGELDLTEEQTRTLGALLDTRDRADRLRRHAHQVTWVPVTVDAARLRGRWRVDLPAGTDPADPRVTALRSALQRAGAEAVLGAAAGPPEHGDVAGVVVAAALAPDPGLFALAAARDAGDADGPDAPRWFLTEGAVSTGAHDPVRTVAQAAVWGLGQVVSLELPSAWGGLADVGGFGDRDLDALCAMLAAADRPVREDQIALRDGHVRGRRVIPTPDHPTNPPTPATGTAGADTAGAGNAGTGTGGTDTAGTHAGGAGTFGTGTAGPETVRAGTAGAHTAGADTTPTDSASSATARTNTAGTSTIGPKTAGAATAATDTADANTTLTDSASSATARTNTAATGTAGPETANTGTAGTDTARIATADIGTASPETASSGTAGADTTPTDTASSTTARTNTAATGTAGPETASAGTSGADTTRMDTAGIGTASPETASADTACAGSARTGTAHSGAARGRGWRARGTVLVTGGTGALGAHVARWLAENGAGRLVLTGRRGEAAAGAAELAAELRERGAEVEVVACDTADRAAVADLIARHRPTSVFHAAGVFEARPVTGLSAEEWSAVVAGKADGACHLDELTREAGLELDAFVLFSSVAGVWGSAGQAAYAAGNAVLDALAQRRRADGLPATSIAWGPWEGAGMAADEEMAGLLRRSGLRPLPPADALAAMERVLASGRTCQVVADVDWQRLTALFGAVRPGPLFALSAAHGDTEAGMEGEAAGGGGFARRVGALPPLEQERTVLALVRDEVAAALGHDTAHDLDVTQTFKSLGLDSLTAVEVRDRISKATGLALPAIVVFDHPTPRDLAAAVRDRLTGAGREPAPSANADAATTATATDEPIAVIGMACRYPGGTASPEDLWRLVVEEQDAIVPFPTDRGWDLAAVYDPAPASSGTSYSREGGFLDDIAGFEPGLFGISPREALAMDPHQRLLLETTWESFERAGIPPTSLRGSSTGVFVGAGEQDYAGGVTDAPEGVAHHLLLGHTASVLSGRVAYVFGLEGPTLTLDTACSAGLVALHLAVRALRGGECDLAVAAGATVMSTPGGFVEFSRQQVLGRSGRCRSYADDADGSAFSEGIGTLVVERLSDARRHGHPVLAVIRGSAVNQDGASNGLSAPSGRAQQRVIRQALADAGLTPADVDAVEGHGTGTPLGDPIEVAALLATYGQHRPAEHPLYLGSLKSNIGHTQAAAGIAGVIKMVHALHHGLLPSSLHATQPTTHVDWTTGAIELLTEQREWPQVERARRAAVSAFGISGTNAHVILEQFVPGAAQGTGAEGGSGPAEAQGPSPRLPFAPSALADGSDGPDGSDNPDGTAGPTGLAVLPLSAATAAGLRGQARRLRDSLAARPALELRTLGRVMATTRVTDLEHRAAVVAGDRDDALAALTALADGEAHAHLVSGTAAPGAGPVLVFPGQGSQWPGMAVELLDSSPAFARSLAECDAALGEFVDWSVLDVLYDRPGAPSPQRLDVVQPLLFAVMVALARTWQAAGVLPAAVVGHSQGEVAAACVAGALSLPDAARIICLRSRTMQEELSGLGAMASVARSQEWVAARLERWGDRLSVAAVNGPESVVVSGEAAAVEEFLADAEALGARARRVKGAIAAGHSAQVEVVRERVLAELGPVAPKSGQIPVISTVTGAMVDGAGMDAGYWYRNMREPVRFDAAVRELLGRGHRVFLEVSPHPVLLTGLQETTEDAGASAAALGTLRRGEGGPHRLALSLGAAYVAGVPVDWPRAVYAHTPPAFVDLPTYAFQRQRYWLDAPSQSAYFAAPAAAPAPASDDDAAGRRFWDAVESGDVDELLGELPLVNGQAASLRDVLPALAGWRETSRQDAALDRWRHRVVWEPVATDPRPALTGGWLLLVPDAPAAAAVAARVETALDAHGARVTRRELPADADRAAVAQALDGTEVPAGVLALTGLLDGVHHEHDSVPRALAATLAVVQALGDLDWPAPLWVLTQGAVGAEPADAVPAPEQATVWGLGATARQEHPERWGGVVDLPPEPAPRELARLVAVVSGATGEDEVAVRASGALTRRLVPAPAEDRSQGWKPTGTVLVTGGTGALGGHVARHLAALGAPHLLLTGRRGPDAPGAPELAAELTALGARVTVAACDLGDRTALADLLARVPAKHPLTAVVHTAAVVDDALLMSLTADKLQRSLRAKAQAARHLDELTRELPLDAFVLFSSFAGVTSDAGQGGYAPGNAYLDALALRRRALGLPALSVGWGHWAGDSGLEGGDVIAHRLHRFAMESMDPRRAVRALERAVAGDSGHLVIADVDFDRFDAGSVGVRPTRLFLGLPGYRRAVRPAAGEPATPAETGSGFRDRLAKTAAGDRTALVRDLVLRQLAAVLGHADAGEISATRLFRELGIDSLTAVEFRNRLGAATGLRLPVGVVFDHPTPEALAAHVVTELAVHAGPSADGRGSDEGAGSDDATGSDDRSGSGSGGHLPVEVELDRLEAAVDRLDAPASAEVAGRLRALLARLPDAPAAENGDALASATTAEEVLGFIQERFGR